ncbi:MAG: hypothetical protein HDS68_03435 [Bacteroidales bacterium]|nr:hypothetical protein [Bacteroidales bacterium]
MKPFILLLCSAAALSGGAAQKLTGTPIGTEQCIDYDTGQPSTTVHNVDNLFDGDLDTYFATYQRSYTWGGLDLGTPHVIERVGWAPRNDYWEGPARVKMAVIQGANSPDWLDAVPLYLITEDGVVNQMTYADVNCSKGFRYVRYVSPSDKRCNLAELEFYGHKGEGDESNMYQFTNNPTVIVNTVDAREPFDKVTNITCNIIMINNNTYNVAAPGTIRERGNSSRNHAKKPWRIKFDKKQNVLDAPAKAKKWTLINSHSDMTLLRNVLAFEISRRVGMEYSPYCRPVDVVLNGEFKGCYQLTDQVEAKEGRIPITEMEPTDISGEALTGGYHFEIDSYASEEPEGTWFTSTKSKIPVTVKSPDDGGMPQQFAYIQDYFNKFDELVKSRMFSDETTGYRQVLDLDSYLRYFICQELFGNADAVWSVHMYKERSDDFIHVGPVWDSELAFDNDWRTYPANTFTSFTSTSGRGPIAGGFLDFHKRIFLRDSKAAARRSHLYSVARNENDLNGESLCEFIDRWASEIKESAELNFKRWDVLGKVIFCNPRLEYSFEEAIDNLKTYMRDRVDYLDRAEFFDYDPEASSVEIAVNDFNTLDEDLVIANRRIGLDSGKAFRVHTIDGKLCFDGTGFTNELNAGIYIVTSEGTSVKVALQ